MARIDYKSLDPNTLSQKDLLKVYNNITATINMRMKLKTNSPLEEAFKQNSDFIRSIEHLKKKYPSMFTKKGNLKRGKSAASVSNLNKLLNVVNTKTVKSEFNELVQKAGNRLNKLGLNAKLKTLLDVKDGNVSSDVDFAEIYEEYKKEGITMEYWNIVDTQGYTKEVYDELVDRLNKEYKKKAYDYYNTNNNFKKHIDSMAQDLFNREEDPNFIGPKSERTLSDYMNKIAVEEYLNFIK